MKKLILLVKFIFIIAGSILLFYSIRLFTVANYNLGLLLQLLLSLALIGFGIFFGKLYKWIKITFISALAIVIAFSAGLFIYGRSDNADFKETAVIVLGAGIRGETPSYLLSQRLDKSYEYYLKNPNVTIIVSGGQGTQENISEALAMERYLISRGVPQNKIIKEDKSTSTKENFESSKEILDRNFKNYTVAYITNDFHIYRAGLMAKSAGLNPKHIGADTNRQVVIPCYLREILAVIYKWVIER